MTHRFKKRERTQNWSPEEKILLLKLCEDKLDVLETKRSDQISIAKKSNAWREIRAEFVAALGIDRDLSRLKEQWQRMKCQARSDLQDFAMRLRKFGPQVANQKRPNQMSTEVWRVMETARKYFSHMNGTDNDEDSSIKEINWSLNEANCLSNSPERSECDTAPSLLCETEVKSSLDDGNSSQNPDHQNLNDYNNFLQFSNGSESPNVTQTQQAKLDYYAKRDFVLQALANAQQRHDDSEIKPPLATPTCSPDDSINQHLIMLFEAKKIEQEKRLQLMDEQMKTARINRETAEIQKQIAQHQLNYTLQKYRKDNRAEHNFLCNDSSGSFDSDDNFEDNRKKIKEDVNEKVSYHEERIRCHQEAINRHRRCLLEIQTE